MSRLGLAALAVLFGLLTLPAAAAAQPGELDVATLAQRLENDPVQVLPGALATVDAERVRAELERTVVRGSSGQELPDVDVYVVVAPPDGSVTFDRLYRHLDADDEVILVNGLRTDLRSWDEYARGNYVWATDEVLGDILNEDFERVVLPTYDVTGVVLGALRVLGDQPRWEIPDSADTPYGDQSFEDSVIAALRKDPVYVDPAVPGDPDSSHWDPFPANPPTGEHGYRVVYLSPDGPLSVYEIARAFPEDVVVVMRGHLLEQHGPGSHDERATALVRAQKAVAPDEYESGPYPPASTAVRVFFTELIDLRGGSLDGPAGASLTTSTWTFGATGGAIAVIGVGLWWHRRQRERRSEDREFRTSSARAAADLARLAVAVNPPPGTQPTVDDRLLAQAAERYDTARDLVERATTPAELHAAREVLTEGRRLAGEPAPSPTPPMAPTAPRSNWIAGFTTDRAMLGIAVTNGFLAFLPGRTQRFGDRDPEATILAGYGCSALAVAAGLYLLLRGGSGGQLSTTAAQGWGLGLILFSVLPVLVLGGLGDLTITVIVAVLVAGYLALRNRPPWRARARTVAAANRGLWWIGIVTTGYAVLGYLAERTSMRNPVANDVFHAVVILGYGVAGVLVAFGLFLVLVGQRFSLEARQQHRRATAAARASALADLLRLSVSVTAHSDDSDGGERARTAAQRYAAAMEAFTTASTAEDFARVSQLTNGTLSTQSA